MISVFFIKPCPFTWIPLLKNKESRTSYQSLCFQICSETFFAQGSTYWLTYVFQFKVVSEFSVQKTAFANSCKTCHDCFVFSLPPWTEKVGEEKGELQKMYIFRTERAFRWNSFFRFCNGFLLVKYIKIANLWKSNFYYKLMKMSDHIQEFESSIISSVPHKCTCLT